MYKKRKGGATRKRCMLRFERYVDGFVIILYNVTINVSANQRSGLPSLLSGSPEKLKIGRGCRVISSCSAVADKLEKSQPNIIQDVDFCFQIGTPRPHKKIDRGR